MESVVVVVWAYRYRHLMLNVVSLLPHSKKDNKVESAASKGATLNELVELKSGSSCLFFEVTFFIPPLCFFHLLGGGNRYLVWFSLSGVWCGVFSCIYGLQSMQSVWISVANK